jgi:hypothetical protein
MIDKVKPQALNSDVDSRNRPSNQMIDALNIAFEESYKDSVATLGDPGGGDFSGDFGSIKPMPSNRDIESILDLDDEEFVQDNTSIRVIGSVTDDIYNVIFFFVWSDMPEQMGVWAWDRDAILPGNEIPGSYIKVFTSEKFNFPSDGFVKGDVVHIGQSDIRIASARSASNNINESRAAADAGAGGPFGDTPVDDDGGIVGEPPGYVDPADRLDRVRKILLYFTDNRNEPKKLDVFKVMTYSQQIEDLYNNDDILDLICACPRTPETPIRFVFDFDATRIVSNFANMPGVQFAYQYVYDDNVESPISTYSKLAVPPAYITLGETTASPYLENRCRLLIPRGTREVKEIRILIRYSNDGSFKLIDVIDQGVSGLSPLFEGVGDNIQYNFYNDRVLVPVSNEKTNMHYSNLPRVAQAQTVVSDRLLYGNYLENYPAVETSATATPIYGDTPEEGYYIELKVKPLLISPGNWNNPGTVSGVGNSRIAGYQVHLGGIPDSLGQNSVIMVEWTTVPDDHFHVYNHHKSFHGNSQQHWHQYDGGIQPSGEYVNTDSQNEDGSIDSDHHDDMMSGRTMFGKNKGLHFLDDIGGEGNLNTWRCSVPNTNGNPGDYTEEVIPCAYGTSAANPLIFKAEPLNFKVHFQTNWSVESNARYYVRDAIYNLLGDGNVLMPMQDGIPFANEIEIDNTSSYNINLQLSGDVNIIETEGGDEGQERLDMICGVKKCPTGDDLEDVLDQSPIGYFIINKASVEFGLRAYPDAPSYTPYTNDEFCYFGLDLKELNATDIRTCIPYIPWDEGGYNVGIPYPQAMAGSYMQGNNNMTSWGNVYMEAYSGNENNPVVSAWMPPAMVNTTIMKWYVYSSSYIGSTDPVTIAGHAPWENFVDDAGYGEGPSNETKLSALGHKNLLYLHPDNINNFLSIFQQITTGYGGEYTFQSILGSSALFPVASTSPGRFYTVGKLGPPAGMPSSFDLDLVHTSDQVSSHYNDYNKVFTIVDSEGAWKEGVLDYTRDYTAPEQLSEVDTYYSVDPIIFAGTNFVYPGNWSDMSTVTVPNRRFGSTTPYMVFKGHILPQPVINLYWAVAGAGTELGNGVYATFYRKAILKHFRIKLNTNEVLLYESNPATSPMYEFYPDPHMLGGANYLLDAAGYGESDHLMYTPANTIPMGGYYDGLEPQNYASDRGSWVEVTNQYSIVGLTGGEYYPRSFKTRANHEFGIVYYDQRGRAGHANFLAETYVKGYSDIERGSSSKGRVDIRIDINSFPPRWATHYQIVYGGNSTVREFVQYTTGLAFIENTNPDFDETVDNNNAIMYVSLGYLQGENDVSYSHNFGAMHSSGNKDLYTYSEGDKLRIIRYTENDGSTVVYPDSSKYEFEIVGLKTMTSNLEDNILVNISDSDDESFDTYVPMQKSGQFLMIKNNLEATGFTYADVAQDMPMLASDYASSNHYWNNNCIVEILKPKAKQDFDEKLYYEIGEKYDIVLNPDGIKMHGTPSITLSDGDVWWRPIPVNSPEYGTPPFYNTYQSLIHGSTVMGGNESKSRFLAYYLESNTFTDIIPDAASKDWGKPKVIVPDAQTLYKRSSITYSDKNNYTTKRNDFTIFNASTFNFKNLPNEYGSINYILNDYDSVFVIQEDKASTIPVSRNILSTAGGQEQLMASEKVLGTQKFYLGDYGADNNPESATRAEENIYWASKSKREVYKWSRKKGIEVISKNGMKAYFNNVFKRAIEEENMGGGRVRVVGGYDPLRDEFIISIHNMVNLSELEGFYDFEMDGEYITIDPDLDIDPVIGEPVVDFGCVEFDFISQQSANPATLLPGDTITFNVAIMNNSDAVGQINAINYTPMPPHVISVTGVQDILGIPILQGESVEITVEMQIPNNYDVGTYPYSLLFTYSSEADECEDVTNYQYNLPVSVTKPDNRNPKDPTAAFDGKKLLELPSTDIPIPTISSNGNGGANGGGSGPGFGEPGFGDPHGGGGIFDGGNGSNGNGSDGDENGSGDDIKIKIVPPTGNPENSFWLGGGGTGPGGDNGDDDVIPDTPPSINWCEYAWVGTTPNVDEGLVTVSTVYLYWLTNEDNIWNILPTAVYDYLSEYVEGGATVENFIEVYFAEEGGYVSYQCSVNGNGNGLIYDINGDGVVNILDLITLEEFIVSPGFGYDPAYDFNSDGSVDILDYAILGDNMPEPPFDICEYISDDGEIDVTSLEAFLIDFDPEDPNYDTSYEYFMSFYGMTAEQIGCRDPEDE